MKKIIFLLSALALGLFANAQANFQKAITIPFLTDAYTRSIVQCSDGGYLVGCGTSYYSQGHSTIIKTNAVGAITWAKSFASGSTSSSVIQAGECQGGYYVFADNADVVAANNGFSVTRLDASGNTIWAKIYPYEAPNYGYSKIRPTNDGGFVISESFITKMGALKIDGNGNVLWHMSYSDDPDNLSAKCPSFDCYIAHDGNLTFVGKRNNDILVVKTDANGQLVWSSTIGDQVTYYHANSITGTADGGYIIGGYGDYRPFLLKITSLGAIVWYHEYASIFTSFYTSEFTQVKELSNGNIMALNTENHFGLIATFNPSGNVLSASRFGNGVSTLMDSPVITITNDGGFAVAGLYTDVAINNTALALLKTDTAAQFACGFHPLNLGFYSPPAAPSVLNVPIYSFVQPQIVSPAVHVLTPLTLPEANFCLTLSTGDQQTNASIISTFPSPVVAGENLHLNITGAEGKTIVAVYDVNGQLVKTLNANLSANTMLEIPTTDFASGIYLVRITGEKENVLGTTRFIVR